MKKYTKKRSFKHRLIVSFCIVSIIPIIMINIYSYYNIKNKVLDNMDELKSFSLEQVNTNIKTVLSSYEDLLYQMYTDDDIVAYVDKINAGDNVAVSRYQLRRTLRGLASIKDYIQCITVITKNGSLVTYDKLASSISNTEWISRYKTTADELFNRISKSNKTGFLSTKYATQFDARPYYLFHMTHRVIDYKNIAKKNGVIILSIDERLLNKVYSRNSYKEDNVKPDSMNIIVDKTGTVVSFEDAGRIGTKVVDPKSPGRRKDSAYIRLVKDSGFLSGNYLKVYSIYDEDQDWYIANVSDQSNVIAQLKSQQKMTSLVLTISLVMLIIIIIFVTNRLSGSIGKIVKAMKVAESGELSVRVQQDENMPVEIETIANQFNSMLGKLHASIEKEKEAGIKQKSAEISALEAQINPHFLYNTLDTINWMAIDHDEYEISNAINSLAKILRYGVDKSNSMVEIKQEVEWLKQYVFLQQTRLKNTFECILNIEPNVLGFHIHKLLLQPFVENAIIHGFEGVKRKHELEISIWEGEDTINIRIADNGKGIPDQQLKEIRDGLMNSEEEKSHIGISNAIGRLHMYYTDKAKVQIDSELEAGTTILIEIPKL